MGDGEFIRNIGLRESRIFGQIFSAELVQKVLIQTYITIRENHSSCILRIGSRKEQKICESLEYSITHRYPIPI